MLPSVACRIVHTTPLTTSESTASELLRLRQIFWRSSSWVVSMWSAGREELRYGGTLPGLADCRLLSTSQLSNVGGEVAHGGDISSRAVASTATNGLADPSRYLGPDRHPSLFLSFGGRSRHHRLDSPGVPTMRRRPLRAARRSSRSSRCSNVEAGRGSKCVSRSCMYAVAPPARPCFSHFVILGRGADVRHARALDARYYPAGHPRHGLRGPLPRNVPNGSARNGVLERSERGPSAPPMYTVM